MATLLSRATGNFTAAGTWELIDSTSLVNSESATGTVTTSYLASTGATTGVITATGIGLKLSVRTGTTGTLSTHLAVAGVEVSGTLVTINTADLPVAASADLNGGWHFFKFSSPVTLSAATSYTVEVKTSSSSQIGLFASSGTLWSHFISTSTTQAPALGDDLIVAGEYTGAGTSNSFTVTMNNTATTDFGAAATSLVTPSLAICNKGTLTYGVAASTNYYLKQSGNVVVYSGGFLNIGTVGAEIPRNSTAVLEFDCAADVDFGLNVRNLGSLVCQGLSRTSGKNIFWTKLSANTDAQKTASITATSASPCVFTWTSNTLANGDIVQLTGTAPTGFVINTPYFVVNNATDGAGKFRLAATLGGADMNSSSTGSSLVGWSTADKVLDVTDDTGWLDNDIIVVAPTQRTVIQDDYLQLNGNASATQITVDGGPAYYHDGVSPVQAEVILLTRNVIIRAALSTAVTYIYTTQTAVVDIDWVEIYNTGSTTTNKQGFDMQSNSGNIQYSSFHDCKHTAVDYGQSITRSGQVCSNNVFYNWNTSAGVNKYAIACCTDDSTATYDTNIFIGHHNNANSSAFLVKTGSGSTISNVYSSGTGNCFSQPSAPILVVATLSNVNHHSSAGGILQFSNSDYSRCVMSNFTAYRNTSTGLTLTGYGCPINTVILFGNTTQNISLNNGCNWTITNGTSSGDTTFSTTNGVTLTNVTAENITFITFTFGVVSGIKTAHTNDINWTGISHGALKLNNCILASATEITGLTTNADAYSYVSEQKHDQTAGVHKISKRFGVIAIDTVTVHTGSQSMKMTPNNATYKLSSEGVCGGFKVAVASGATVTPTVYVYEDASYNGNRARLIVKRNDAIGITADTVLATATAASDAAWEALSGTTAAATDDGTMEFVVDCDGTAGNLFVDSFSVV